MTKNAQPIRPARVEFFDGGLRSKIYRDSYFMPGQGLAESQAVFIDGNHLGFRFAQLEADQVFVIGENGFGSGLNVLLAADCFDRRARSGSRLRLFSTELHPLTRSDLAAALENVDGLEPWAQRLLGAYPPPVPGYHRIVLDDRIELVLMFGEARSLWRQADIEVDAWFLDGFAPSSNPEMWHSELLTALGRCSRPGATLSTFTAAGEVRRGLEAAGFEVQRVPGYAHKRHRLQARRPGEWRAARRRRGHALVAGAGLAGATTARALADRGWSVHIIDRSGPASGASGNAAGVLYTTPSAHLTPQNRYYQTAFVRAQAWLRHYRFPDHDRHGRLNDVIQCPTSAKHEARLEQALGSGAWPDELLCRRQDGTFCLRGGGYLHPASWIGRLLNHPAIHIEQAELTAVQESPIAILGDGRELEADAVVLCLAHHTAELAGLNWLFIKRIRGQVSECAPTSASSNWTQAICHGGYLTPALDGRHSVGASYDLERPQHGVDPLDDQRNLDQLKTYLPERWTELGGDNAKIIGRRVGVRCQSPDFLPQAGPLPDPRQRPHSLFDDIHLNIAHGSRGLTHTPLAADMLADQLCGLASSVEPDLVSALAPERFILRRRKRDPRWLPE